MELFRRNELLDWSEFESVFSPVLREGKEDGPATGVFQQDDTLGERHWEDFRKRVIEHVCSTWYCVYMYVLVACLVAVFMARCTICSM